MQERISRRIERLDPFLLLVGTALGLLVLGGFLRPGGPFALVNRDLDLAYTGLITGISVMAAGLQWSHYSEEQKASAFLLGSAFLVYAISNTITLLVVSFGLDEFFGMSLASPGQEPIYAGTATKFVAALLFATAGVAELRRWRSVPAVARLACYAAIGLAFVALPVSWALTPSLPTLYESSALTSGSAGLVAGLHAGGTPGIVFANLVIAAVFVGAMLAYRRLAHVANDRQAALLAVAFLIAAFSHILFGVVPAAYTGVLSAGVTVEGLFYVYLVLAFQDDARVTIADLRRSRRRLQTLRDAEVARAILEERARLAREVHDGLTQELWLAKIGIGEVADAERESGGEHQEAIERTRAAIDTAITEARNAILALSSSSDISASFVATLTAYVEDLGDRLGIPVTMEVEPMSREVPIRTSTEVVRIVQEALSNVRKHSQATTARVVVSATERGIRVAVEDDGRGIDPDGAARGHGLRSMRERTRAIGGELTIEPAEPGTRVVLEFPTGAPDAGGPAQ